MWLVDVFMGLLCLGLVLSDPLVLLTDMITLLIVSSCLSCFFAPLYFITHTYFPDGRESLLAIYILIKTCLRYMYVFILLFMASRMQTVHYSFSPRERPFRRIMIVECVLGVVVSILSVTYLRRHGE